MTNQKINFKDPLWMVHFLDTAVETEKDKLRKRPVNTDLVADHETVQGWGYGIVGYHLVEESLKALLFMRGVQVPMKHSLKILFDLLEHDDQELLREYHVDFLATNYGYDGFPFATLDEFLTNLDGDPNGRGDYVGSFDWRYFLIAETSSSQMPIIGIELLHEITYGATRMIDFARSGNFDPSEYTHGWRMRWKRERKYRDWMLFQQSSGGWEKLIGKLAVFWGPDKRERYDMVMFRRDGVFNDYFAPKPTDASLVIVDKREEIEKFDAGEALRSVRISVAPHHTD